MTTDWVQWHRDYDRPNSSLARRLHVVQECLRHALAEIPPGPRRLISVCAGDGRDVLPMLAAHDPTRRIRALLVELDPRLATRAQTTAAQLGLRTVEVRTTDAGATDCYADFVPADVVLACGVFGNIGTDDVERTIAALPRLLTHRGVVIWTRGRPRAGPDPSLDIRAMFSDHGFAELSFTAPADATFRVGMHHLDRPPDGPPAPGTRMFVFNPTSTTGDRGVSRAPRGTSRRTDRPSAGPAARADNGSTG